MKIEKTIIKFPEIKLLTRDAHKLRGFFGSYFKDKSTLLHNHFNDGTTRYKYPLVQYKVVDNIPLILGFNEGANLLAELFFNIKKIEIEGKSIEISEKHIENSVLELGVSDFCFEYKFKTLWMGLNQNNFNIYLIEEDKKRMLTKILNGNILSFYKGLDYYTDRLIETEAVFREKQTSFKGKEMLAFEGSFKTNAIIPDYAGLGKSVARGFGTVIIN